MDPDRKLVIFVAGLMVALSTVLFLTLIKPRMCAFALELDSKSAGACFDFWLNRYQTLLGGIFTLAGAGVAALFVVRQTRVARQQLDVMLGEIEPDFLVVGDYETPLQDFRISVFNQNRSPIELRAISVERPCGLQIVITPSDDFQRVSCCEDEQTFYIRLLIPGTRPSASTVSSSIISGWFSMEQDDAISMKYRAADISLRIDYDILGSRKASRSRQLYLADASIAMTFYSLPDGKRGTTMISKGNRRDFE